MYIYICAYIYNNYYFLRTHTHTNTSITHTFFTPSLIPPLLQHQDLLLRVHVIDFHLKCH